MASGWVATALVGATLTVTLSLRKVGDVTLASMKYDVGIDIALSKN